MQLNLLKMKILINENQFKKLISHKELTEDPEDVIFYDENENKKYLSYNNDDTIAFGFYKGNPYVGYSIKYGKQYANDFMKFYRVDVGDAGEGLNVPIQVPGRFTFHGNIYMFNNFLVNKKILKKFLDSDVSRSAYDYPGRLWIDSKVISFYTTPPKNEYYSLIKNLQDAINYIYNININLFEFKIDVDYYFGDNSNKLVTPEEYVGHSNVEEKKYDDSKIHLLPSDQKRESPQMKGYLALKDKMDREKYKKTPEYLWNFWKNKNLAEDNTK